MKHDISKDETIAMAAVSTIAMGDGHIPHGGGTRFSTLPDFMLARYEVKRAIGSGGFGIVYLAMDRKLGRLVAVKRLFDDRTRDQRSYDLFLQEARIAGRLEHPNIVIVYNIEESDGSVCMVMEYLGGGSLGDIMAKNPQMKLKTAVHIMLGILTGLEAAHNIGVVHRDIKPQNILFGIGSNPKITDFGVAHFPASEGGMDIHADGEILMGSPSYMAPEQLLGGRVDLRSDLYSAGMIFHEMLSGQRLFPVQGGEHLADIRGRFGKFKPPLLREFRGDITPEVEEVAASLLARSASERYPDAFTARRGLVRALAAIGNDDDLEENLQSAPISYFLNSAATILEDIIYLLLIDGEITIKEREELGRRTEKLGLSDQQAAQIERKLRMRLGLPLDLS